MTAKVLSQGLDDVAAETMAIWRWKPVAMVHDLFGAVPDGWQADVLDQFPHRPRIAMEAAKGPGKTACLAWCSWNFLLTRRDSNVAATSITGDNLRDGLWKEMSVWQARSKLLQDNFLWGAQRITRKTEAASRWFMSAKTWPKAATTEELGNVLAGFHANHVLFVLDEMGSAPPAILQSAEGIMANAGAGTGKEAHILMAGNTNSLSGALYDACVKHKELWYVVKITADPDDPKRSPRISLEWARSMIKEHGRDNPFIKILILGEWPTGSINALFDLDIVRAAQERRYPEHEFAQAAKILSVDVAREGDDYSVMTKRQGRIIFPQRRWLQVSGIVGGAAVNLEWNNWQADACFIDMTGGHGASWFDHLTLLGKAPIGVQYSGEAHNKALHHNKRAEMYVDFRDWLKTGGQLPQSDVWEQELPEITYTYQGDKLLLEPKKLIKVRIGRSPDHSDSAVQTFAEPVSPRALERPRDRSTNNACGEYDTFKEAFGVPW